MNDKKGFTTPPTTTVYQITESTLKKGDGKWKGHSICNSRDIFYHVDLCRDWPFGSHLNLGRWAGRVKPTSKKHAIELYHTDHLGMNKKWYLFTFKFKIEENHDSNAIYFQSKVKHGTGHQIKINNIAIDKVEVISIEELNE